MQPQQQHLAPLQQTPPSPASRKKQAARKVAALRQQISVLANLPTISEIENEQRMHCGRLRNL